MDFWEKPLIGIYKITRRVTGKAYIGQSIDIFRRWKEHICFGEDKKNWQVIKHALYKYGITEFTFEILEECSKEDLNNREIYWISYFNKNYLTFSLVYIGAGSPDLHQIRIS
jgi:group I intron endonuclease